MRNYGQRKCKWCGGFGSGYDCKIGHDGKPVPNGIRSCVSPEQRQSLAKFKHEHGRRWKWKLNICWQTGNYPYASHDPRVAILQGIRNQFGPEVFNSPIQQQDQ